MGKRRSGEMSYAGREPSSGNDPSPLLGMELSAKRWNMEILEQIQDDYFGVQGVVQDDSYWIPAFAGMTH